MEIKLYEKARDDFLNSLLQAARDEAEAHPSPFLSKQTAEERMLLQAHDDVDILLASLTTGIQCLQKEASALSSCLSPEEQVLAEAALASLSAALAEERTSSDIDAMVKSETSTYQQMGLSESGLNVLYLVGREMVKQRRFKEAYGVFVVLTTLAPHIPEIWIGLGQVEQQTERWDAALVAFDQALQLAPSAMAKACQADCYSQLHQTEEAAAALKEALDLCKAENPFDSRLYEYIEGIDRSL